MENATSCSQALAIWLTAIGTLILAAVAVFQDTIRAWFYRPKFDISIKTEPPCCALVPFTRQGEFVADTVYLRLLVKNTGGATARNAEVYASKLERQRADRSWESMATFPPMNFKWSNLGAIYFPSIAPQMEKYCDIGHITDPTRRHLLDEDAPKLQLRQEQTSLAFDLMAAPNHKGHIVGPGEYRLELMVAAENARPVRRTLSLSIRGSWFADETTMLRDGVGARVEAV